MFYFAVDGNWSPWSQWSGCGAGLCGGNKKVRTRSCTNPHPSGGGKNCPGESFEEGSCPGMIIIYKEYQDKMSPGNIKELRTLNLELCKKYITSASETRPAKVRSNLVYLSVLWDFGMSNQLSTCREMRCGGRVIRTSNV